MSDFVAPNTEYMEGKLKILWFPKITNVKEVQTVLPIAPWQLKELIHLEKHAYVMWKTGWKNEDIIKDKRTAKDDAVRFIRK